MKKLRGTADLACSTKFYFAFIKGGFYEYY